MSARSKGLCRHHKGECHLSVRVQHVEPVRIGGGKANTWVRLYNMLIMRQFLQQAPTGIITKYFYTTC
ncbi:MAG TPA: hypothetical protein ENI73_06535 [Spirochaetes bacterium]|nr:hypothetical protein [Spirochaetota bacterium]